MPSYHRKEKPGRFGTWPVALCGQVSAVTANTTTDVLVGGYPVRTVIAPKFAISVNVAPADADGAITGILYKYDASADAAVALSAATNLETLTAKEARAVSLTSTLTAAQRTMDVGDVLYFRVTNDSAAIDTNVGALHVTAELFVQE